jgi:hypothetical protein
MALPSTGGSQEQGVFALGAEPRRRQVVNECAVHFLIEIKVEAVERAIGIAKARVAVAALGEPILATEELVGDQRRDQIDGRHCVGPGLAAPRFEDGRHTREAEFPERVIEFDQIHRASPVLRSIRSR